MIHSSDGGAGMENSDMLKVRSAPSSFLNKGSIIVAIAAAVTSTSSNGGCR